MREVTADAGSLASQAFGLSVPLLNQSLNDVLQSAQDDIGDILAQPFQSQSDGDSWTTLTSQLAQAGISVDYPTSPDGGPATSFTGGQNGDDDYLLVQWTYQPSSSGSTSLSDLGLADFGNSGFSYLNGGSLTGSLSGSVGPVQAQVMMGVDAATVGGTPTFFVDVTPADTNITVSNISATGSVSGDLSIGELANVTVGGTASLSISSAALTFQGDSPTSAKLHIPENTTPTVGATGTINGYVQLAGTFGAQVPPLPEIDWSGTFTDDINGAAFQAPPPHN